MLKDNLGNFHADLSNPKKDQEVWEQWFVPFFETINNNADVIKAFSYINVEWKSQMMWQNNAYFKNVDSRIQKSEFLTKKWLAEINNKNYLKPSDCLFKNLLNK